MYDIAAVRKDFPALDREFEGRPLIYLDSAATYLKPQRVIDAVSDCYRRYAGTVGRGVHVMSAEAMDRFDEARETIANFINADPQEVIFVRSATEAINLVASSLAAGSRVLGSIGEHHSNLLPWRSMHDFQPLQLDDRGAIVIDALKATLAAGNTQLVTCSSVGNAFGNVHPVEQLADLAHAAGADVFIDINQSIAHERTNVRQLDCDYACFSGHKLGGPTGLGVLYAKPDRLEQLRPLLLGGGMVESVTDSEYVLEALPMRLEAGTAHFEGVIGLAAACEYLDELSIENISQHEQQLTSELLCGLDSVPRVLLHGPKDASKRGAIVSFSIDGLEAHGAARMLSNRANLCLRSGYHCAQLAHSAHGVKPTVRASFGVYNTSCEVATLIDTLQRIIVNL